MCRRFHRYVSAFPSVCVGVSIGMCRHCCTYTRWRIVDTSPEETSPPHRPSVCLEVVVSQSIFNWRRVRMEWPVSQQGGGACWTIHPSMLLLLLDQNCFVQCCSLLAVLVSIPAFHSFLPLPRIIMDYISNDTFWTAVYVQHTGNNSTLVHRDIDHVLRTRYSSSIQTTAVVTGDNRTHSYIVET